jgi:hypothetical protein
VSGGCVIFVGFLGPSGIFCTIGEFMGKCSYVGVQSFQDSSPGAGTTQYSFKTLSMDGIREVLGWVVAVASGANFELELSDLEQARGAMVSLNYSCVKQVEK